MLACRGSHILEFQLLLIDLSAYATVPLGLWRIGSVPDSRSEGCEFESLWHPIILQFPASSAYIPFPFGHPVSVASGAVVPSSHVSNSVTVLTALWVDSHLGCVVVQPAARLPAIDCPGIVSVLPAFSCQQAS